jgi:hypothetical protein
MKSHVVEVQPVKSKLWMRGARRANVYRWQCSCGRIGPEQIEARRARNGGARHVAAQERK